MRVSDWSSDLCSSDLRDLGVEDLLGFDDHLPFLLGRSIVEEAVDVRNDVEGDLLGEFLHVLFVADENLARLVPQLVHPRLAGARHRLIGRDDDALDPRRIMQRLQRDDHLRGRTRSEEHTSELQSLMCSSYAVFCLKKK